MPNALHIEYHYAVLDIVKNFGAAALGIAAKTVENYQAVAEKEQDCVNRSRRSGYTVRLNQLDAQRNTLMEAILKHLSCARASLDETVLAASDEIERTIVEQYPLSYKREAALRKTSYIRGLVEDLKKIDDEVLGKMGVLEQSKALFKANEDFSQCYLARNTETNERNAIVVKELRNECNNYYRRLRLEIEYVAGTSDDELAAIGDPTEREKRTAQRTLACRFIDELNRHITYHKAYYLGSRNTVLDGEDEWDGEDDGTGTDGTGAGGDTDGTDASDDAGNGTPNPGSNPGGGPTDVTEVF